eukprot:ANDGO_00806.mRNA.1 Potassium voltage-gated channel protein Shab
MKRKGPSLPSSLPEFSAIDGSSLLTMHRLHTLSPHDPPFREHAWQFLYNSQGGKIWSIVQVFVSLLGCIMLVMDAYVILSPLASKVLGASISACIAADLVLRVYATEPKRRLTAIFSWATFIDIVVIVPELFIVADSQGSQYIQFLRSLRIFRILRVFDYVSQARGDLGVSELRAPSVATVLCEFGVKIFSVIFVAAYVFQFLERVSTGNSAGEDVVNIPFHDAIYFTVVTMSTVGYGDITPTTAVSKMFVTAFILFAVVIIPMEASALIEAIKDDSRASITRHHHLVKSQETQLRRNVIAWHSCLTMSNDTHHVIFAGDFENLRFATMSRTLMQAFLSAGRPLSIAILSPKRPDRVLSYFFKGIAVKGKITYVRGSVRVREDLKAAGGAYAASVVLFDTNNSDAEECTVDVAVSRLLTHSMVVRNDLHYLGNEQCCVTTAVEPLQDFTPSLMTNMFAAIRDCGSDQIVLVEDLAARLLAGSMTAHGLSTMIENLLVGTMLYGKLGLDGIREERELVCTSGVVWLDAYLDGMKNGIRMVLIADNFHGRWTLFDFAFAAWSFQCSTLGIIRRGTRKFTGFNLSDRSSKDAALQNGDVVVVLGKSLDPVPLLSYLVATSVPEPVPMATVEADNCTSALGLPGLPGLHAPQRDRDLAHEHELVKDIPTISLDRPEGGAQCEPTAASCPRIPSGRDAADAFPVTPSILDHPNSSAADRNHVAFAFPEGTSSSRQLSGTAATASAQRNRSKIILLAPLSNSLVRIVSLFREAFHIHLIKHVTVAVWDTDRSLDRNAVRAKAESLFSDFVLESDDDASTDVISSASSSPSPSSSKSKPFAETVVVRIHVLSEPLSLLNFISNLNGVNALEARSVVLFDPSRSMDEMVVLINAAERYFDGHSSKSRVSLRPPHFVSFIPSVMHTDELSVLRPQLQDALSESELAALSGDVWAAVQHRYLGTMFHMVLPAFFLGSTCCAIPALDALLGLASIDSMYVDVAYALAGSIARVLLPPPSSQDHQGPATAAAATTTRTWGHLMIDAAHQKGVGMPLGIVRRLQHGAECVITNPSHSFEIWPDDRLMTLCPAVRL